MEKKKSWLARLKRFFTSGSKEKPEKELSKEKGKGWFLGRFRQQHSLALPAPTQDNLLRRAEEEQSKHAVTVALATAAAAEAAVVAAQKAAEVVRLTTGLPAYKLSEERAAIKLQTAYRGYLARRALRALKGLVKLQALIRGEAVRRQMTLTLRGLESLMKIQTHSQSPLNSADLLCYEDQDYASRKASQWKGRWDGSILSKEELTAMLKSREEAAVKRLRALQYASANYEKMNTRRLISRDELDTLNQRWRWLEHWMISQPFEMDIPESHSTPSREFNGSDPHTSSRESFPCLDFYRGDGNGEDERLKCIARRSFTRTRRTSMQDEDGASCSPAFPGYMASTASTKARYRSMSTPRERSGASDIFSEQGFTYTDRLSPIPSIASDATRASAKTSKPPLRNQKSPRLKAPVPVKSHRPRNNQSFDSECSQEHFTGPL